MTKPPRIVQAVILVAGLVGLTWPAEAEIVHTLEQAYFAGDATGLDIELVIGSLEVEGTEDRNVEVEVRLECVREDLAKCRRRAERIRLRPRLDGDELKLQLENTPRGRAQGIIATMIVRMPASMQLEVDMAGGDVAVRGVLGNIEIDSAGGSVDFRGRQDHVGAFKADVGFGKGDLWLRDSHIEAGGIPRSITWTGSGSQRVEIDLGGGEITARLD